jgi:hypothetical protein
MCQKINFLQGEISAKDDLALVWIKRHEYNKARELLEYCAEECKKLNHNRGYLKTTIELTKLDLRQAKLIRLPRTILQLYTVMHKEGITAHRVYLLLLDKLLGVHFMRAILSQLLRRRFL